MLRLPSDAERLLLRGAWAGDTEGEDFLVSDGTGTSRSAADGGVTWREERFRESGSPQSSSYARSYYSQSVTVYGPGSANVSVDVRAGPPAVASSPPAALTAAGGLLVLAVYAAGAYRFFRGYAATAFRERHKWPLALAWPVLAAWSDRYREGFRKAVRRGGDDSGDMDGVDQSKGPQ